MRAQLVALSTVLAWTLGSLGCGASPESPAAAAGPKPAASESACLLQATAPRARKADEPESISVKHILVKHRDAKNPNGATRTRSEACELAAQARDRILAGAEFDAEVSASSEEPGAASRAGSLGEMRRSDLVPAFADAAFELELGQMSDVVESDFGFHLILRQ